MFGKPFSKASPKLSGDFIELKDDVELKEFFEEKRSTGAVKVGSGGAKNRQLRAGLSMTLGRVAWKETSEIFYSQGI